MALLSGATGTLTLDPKAPNNAKLSVDVPINTIHTTIAKLDEELERRTGVKFNLPEKPEHCVIAGSAAILGTLKEREHLLIKP